MKIALFQPTLDADMDENARKTFAAMDEAAANGADVICFPEIQFSPFFPQLPGQDVARYLMGIEHPLVEKMRDKCADAKMIAVPNFYLQADGEKYDASPVIDQDGHILGVSSMVHVAQVPYFYEQDYYTPSKTGFHVYDTSAGKIGVVVCFDRHYPESIRSCVVQGADIIVIPTANTTIEPMDMFEWELRVAAMQNGVFIAMCNRVGQEGELVFSGESVVVDPGGEVIAKADDREQILYATVDYAMVEKCREKRPYLKFRRPDLYK